jgi:hypothetical protein
MQLAKEFLNPIDLVPEIVNLKINVQFEKLADTN